MADISSEQLRVYRQTARKRWQRVQQQQLVRRKQAMALARQAAQLLKEQYRARQVLLFGSLAHPERRFSLQSDVDLAVWGLTSANWLQASPAVISQETRAALSIYLEFRHVVRNVYTFNLRPDRIAELTRGLTTVFEQTRRDLLKFTDFLVELSRADNEL